MRTPARLRSSSNATPVDREQQLREARVQAARRNNRWQELDPVDLVERLGGRIVVSAETDRCFQSYRGALWQSGTATAIPDFSPLFYVVHDGDRLEFFEQMPDTWTARVERTERRKRRQAS